MIEVRYRRCAGLDVHQREVAVCIRVTPETGKLVAHSRRFATTPAGLSSLREWLLKHDVTHVAMEGTGVYWMPVYEALRGPFDLTLCNAHHVKKVAGRKSDQSDAAWLAQLMSAGLLKKSFVPSSEQRALRELTRARVHRIEDRTRTVNAIHRLLERAGLKLCSVVSDLQGQTAMAILAGLAEGVSDPVVLAGHARGSLLKKRSRLEEVLAAPLNESERLLLAQHLAVLKLFNEQIAVLDEKITLAVAPYSTQLQLLMTTPGIEFVAAVTILAETGPDMSVFDSADGLSAWAGLAPGSNESAGKHKRTHARRGNPYLSRILVQVAIAISRSKKGHDLTAFFRKKLPLGYKKAAVATARRLLVRIWRMLTDDKPYAPPPPPELTKAQRERRVQRLVEALQSLGYTATIERTAA